MTSQTTNDALADLITTYNDLNGSVIEELSEEPSPLEFMRYVSRNTPFVIRGGASGWKATRSWNAAYLTSALKGETVNVAVTPHGNADSPTLNARDGATVFAKPHEEDQQFEEFLTYVIQQETDPAFPTHSEPASTENDNLRDEYVALLPDAQKDIPFARIALGREPEAVNLWIGNSKSITAAHRDNFENIYVQIAGRKHFVLLPALCHPCMNEKLLRPATYIRCDDGELSLQMDHESVPVPFATWDPDRPEVNAAALSHLARPVRITLQPGDMLYLPATWYHKVTQSCAEGDEGFVVAINYWYDMEFSGPLHPLTAFVRSMGLSTNSSPQ
ncbi:Bifunctional peptidase and (3S)-lysyl hydroxylase [Paramyrothecium foliicola]|nr:Bifunctional peptidase and (3S)-lysyl hydroxylase [Paramyrothecium foliicola]